MSVLDSLAQLDAAKNVLLESLSAGISKDDILPALQQLEEFRNSLSQADHYLIDAAQRCALAEKHCLSSVEKLLAQALRISPGDAKRRVRAAAALGPRATMLGEPLPPLRPELAAAQTAGQVSPFAVDLIERTLTKVDVFAPTRTADTEHVLVQHATVFDPVELGKVCDRVIEHVDPDGTRPRDAVHTDRRALHLGRCRDGMTKLDGRLTPAAAARIRAILEPLAAPRPHTEMTRDGTERLTPDVRSREQRMHDALDEACARLLRAGDAPATGGTPATVIITITEEQLQAAAHRAASQAHSQAAGQTSGHAHSQADGQTSGHADSEADDPTDNRTGRRRSGLSDDACGFGPSPGLGRGMGSGLGFGTVETSTGEILSIAEALRLAAEADVIPIVMTGAGRPLHLGRTRRCATTHQTYALIARDGGCSFPGCTVPPEWCERHHLIGWAQGGPTDIDNLTLLCGYHHAHFAQAGWTCHLTPDGLPEWRPPPWIDRHRQPLINHRIQQRHRDRQPNREQHQTRPRDPLLI